MSLKCKFGTLAVALVALLAAAPQVRAEGSRVRSVNDGHQMLQKSLQPRSVGMSMEATPIDRSTKRISSMGSPRGVGCPVDAEVVHNGVDYAVDAELGNFGPIPNSVLGGTIVLGGINRQICQIQHVTNNAAGVPLDTSVTLRIHAGCPAGGDPMCDAAPLLFEDTFAFTAIPTGLVVLDFDLAGVVVPDEIHISVEYADSNLTWIAADFPPDPALMPQPPAYIGAPVTGGWTFCGPSSPGNFACDLFSAGGTGDFGEAIFQVLATEEPEDGSCCDTRTGMCTNVLTFDECVADARDLFFNNFLAGSTCETNPIPCDVSAVEFACDVNDILEGETVCTDNDEYNSGCFSDVDPVNGAFGAPSLAFGDTICGTTGLVLSADGMDLFADNDWYKLVVTEPESQVTLSIESEVEVLFGIIDTGGVDTCPMTFPFVGGGQTNSNGETTIISECLTVGTWYVIVQPTGADPNPGLCVGDFSYRLSADAVSPCINVECPAGSTGQAPNGIGNGADGITFATSDEAIGFAVAENFSPTADAMLEEITWYGAYFEPGFNICSDGPTGTPADDDWTITYFLNDDLNDIPGIVAGGPFSVTATETPTGRVIGGDAEVAFTAMHPPVDVTGGNCFWVEIVNNTTGCFFALSTAPAGDLVSAQRDVELDYANEDESNYDVAICWDTPVAADGCASATDFEGACCLPFGACEVRTLSLCLGGDGIFAGAGTDCGDTDCMGACCVPDTMAGTATCQILTYQQCVTVSTNGNNIYEFLGVGTTCADSPCATGNCCLTDGSCADFANNFIVTHRPNCAPQLLSDEPGNIFDRLNTFTAPPFNQVGGFTEGGACTVGFGDPVCPQPSVFNALDVGCNGSVTLNNTGLGEADNANNGSIDQPDISCIGGGPAEGNGAYWLTFEATNAQTLVSTCATTAVNDTVLAVYTSTGFSPENDIFNNGADFEIACNEDADDPCGGDVNNFNAEVCFDTVPGQRYWVQVASFDVASQGEITTTITCADDVCDAAAPCATCTSDVDGDNDRDGADIQAFANELISPTPNLCADTDGSGTIDLGDIANFVSEVLAGGTCP